MELSKAKVFPILASEYECTACLACENICPKQAIEHYLAEDGHVYVVIQQDKCVGCLKCQRVCKKSKAYYGVNNISTSKIYAAWTTNDDDRANATSGGVFAALARTVIESGGCVIGAELNSFECKHTVIYSCNEIHRLQGSKYMASSMEDVYKIISEELPHRDVLFTGVGCQCAGVLAFFDGFKTDHRLYTVDLVCGGMPSRILIDKFKEQYPDVRGLSSFRSKDKYELKVMTDEGEKVIREKSLPLHGFNCGLTNRYSCYNCQFAKAHRKTDITIGDLWDYSQYPEEHINGISMVIVHAENGKRIVEESSINCMAIDWKGALLHNTRTVCGKQKIFYPRKHLVKCFRELPNEKIVKLYTITMRPSDCGLYVFRLFRFIHHKFESIRNAKTIKQMINSSEKVK